MVVFSVLIPSCCKMLLIVVLLIFCLPTGAVESEECKKSEIIEGRLGEELVLHFSFSDLKDEYNKYIIERYGNKIIPYEIQIQDLKKQSFIRYKNKIDSTTSETIYKDGNPTDSAGNQTEIFMTNDALVVKKTELQTEDAGIYWIEFRSVYLGQKVLIIAGKPTIKWRMFPPNPVLKAEDNYSTILQLECDSVSTSIGDCQLVNNSMYIMWYKNGMRMTELDPTLSQINVTVDHNGGNFTCLTTEYPPCYHRLQNTTHYDGLNIEECDNVFERKTFIVKPQYGPIAVKLKPDQREIIVTKNEDLKVKCSAKCHPKCDVKWEKDFQDLESSDLVTITESIFGSELKIVNIKSSDEGLYSCLVNNIHGEAKKNFTLIVRETEEKVLMSREKSEEIVVIFGIYIALIILVSVVSLVFLCIKYKKYHSRKCFCVICCNFFAIFAIQIVAIIEAIIYKDIESKWLLSADVKNIYVAAVVVTVIAILLHVIVIVIFALVNFRHNEREKMREMKGGYGTKRSLFWSEGYGTKRSLFWSEDDMELDSLATSEEFKILFENKGVNKEEKMKKEMKEDVKNYNQSPSTETTPEGEPLMETSN